MSKNLTIVNNELKQDRFLDLVGSWKLDRNKLSFIKKQAPMSIYVDSIETANIEPTDNIIDAKQVVKLLLVPKNKDVDFTFLSSSINFETRFSDYSSILSVPLEYRDIVNSNMKESDTDVQFIYNLQNIEYENLALSTTTENKLPNFYEPLESDLMPKNNVSSILNSTLGRTSAERQAFKNIFIPYDSIKNIQKQNSLFHEYLREEKELTDTTSPYPYDFPYFTKIKLKDTRASSELSDFSEVSQTNSTNKINNNLILQSDNSSEYDLSSLLMRWYLENGEFFINEKDFMTSSPSPQRPSKKYNSFDFIEWLNYNAPSKLDSLPSQIKALQASTEAPKSLKIAINNYKNLPLLAKSLTKVANSFIDSFISSQDAKRFEDVLVGQPGKSELVFYKIEKYEGSAVQNLIQSIMIPNSQDKIEYFDTQVFYNKKYTYVIKHVYAIFGCDYQYRELVKQSDGTFYLIVDSYPTIKMVEIPAFIKEGTILGRPPLTPDVEFIPVRRQNNKIKVSFKSNYGTERQIPIILNNADNRAVSAIRTNNFETSTGSEIDYDNLSIVTRFEIYRSPTKPFNFQGFNTFANNLFGSVSTISEGTNLLSDSAGIELNLIPDEPYYFVFIARNRLGLASNPTHVYEVIMRNSQGISYPEVNVIELEGLSETRKSHSIMTKFINIRPTAAQVQPDYLKSNLLLETEDGLSALNSKNKDVFLGVTDDNIFGGPGLGKKFKFRIRSKNTNKVFDLNITCKNTRVPTKFDKESETSLNLVPEIKDKDQSGKENNLEFLFSEVNLNNFSNVDILNAGIFINKIKRVVPVTKSTDNKPENIGSSQNLVLFPKDN